jgi:hypothetical protein
MRVTAGVQTTLLCSFCRKPQSAVQQLVSSPSETRRAYICDECIAVCASMVREEPAPAAEALRAAEPTLSPAPRADDDLALLNELLEVRLFEALERWITRETLYDDAAEELAELRSIASRWLVTSKHD